MYTWMFVVFYGSQFGPKFLEYIPRSTTQNIPLSWQKAKRHVCTDIWFLIYFSIVLTQGVPPWIYIYISSYFDFISIYLKMRSSRKGFKKNVAYLVQTKIAINGTQFYRVFWMSLGLRSQAWASKLYIRIYRIHERWLNLDICIYI